MVFKITILLAMQLWSSNAKNYSFPKDFLFGVSTSAYQIEGAWNEEGKGQNIWDTFTHTHPERILDRSTGDISSDSYYNYQDDIKLLHFLGVDFYRFSISWSRLLPTGYNNKINDAGVNYYNNVINGLIQNGIKPMVTLYHWDLPQPLQDIGGWANPLLADYFVDYARVVIEKFGDRVKMWLTFNEPKLICVYGYGDIKFAPGVNASGIGDYLCGKTVLHAHAKVYRMYDEQYKKIQNGVMGIALHSEWFEPYTDNHLDKQAAETKLLFDFGWFGNPIFHKDGDYPNVMKRRIEYQSHIEGFKRSRLPVLDQTLIDFIKGTYDFLGLNMYTASIVAHKFQELYDNAPSYYKDIGVRVWKDPKWKSSTAKRLKVVPWSIQSLLNWIKNRYGNITIIITENGYADDGRKNDVERITFYQEYLHYLLEAINKDNIHVIGFSAWSLLDNFEWFSGYRERYGLFQVDFSSPKRTRSPKQSAYFYKHLITHKNLQWDIKNSTVYIELNLLFILLTIILVTKIL